MRDRPAALLYGLQTPTEPMSFSLPLQRSLRHEYELFVEREIENYKDAVPRRVILEIGDEAAAALSAQPQFALTELMLCGEVDRIISLRLGLPKFRIWRKRHLAALQEYRRPEHWGLDPRAALVSSIARGGESHVLIAGAKEPGPALYLAAHGCAVTALDDHSDAVDRVLSAAESAGLTQHVRVCVGDMRSWVPDVPLSAVVCTPDVLARLDPHGRTRALGRLQEATKTGGVHLLPAASAADEGGWLAELEAQYSGWRTRIEHDAGSGGTFLAHKAIA